MEYYCGDLPLKHHFNWNYWNYAEESFEDHSKHILGCTNRNILFKELKILNFTDIFKYQLAVYFSTFVPPIINPNRNIDTYLYNTRHNNLLHTELPEKHHRTVSLSKGQNTVITYHQTWLTALQLRQLKQHLLTAYD